jgi:TPR repeat protein
VAGNSEAMTNLGFMNQKGEDGLLPNDIKAASLYRKAADAGFPQGMVNLAAFYLEGRGGLPKEYARRLICAERPPKPITQTRCCC